MQKSQVCLFPVKLLMSRLRRPIFTAYDGHRRKSAYYNHFNPMISRIPADGNEPEHFVYLYICRSGHDGCRHLQKRSQAATDKLKAKVEKCNEAHPDQCATPQPKLKTSTGIKYDKHYHRMLIALRCAVYNRPFISVEDQYYKLEVELLRQGMQVCCSGTSKLKLTL